MSGRGTTAWAVLATQGPDQGSWSVIEGPTLVGRDPGCAFVLTDPAVSRQHVELRPTGDTLEILAVAGREFGLGGDRTTGTHAAVGGDVLRLGNTSLRVLRPVDLAADGLRSGLTLTLSPPGRAARTASVASMVRVGRDPQWADLVIDDPTVSGRHLELQVAPGGAVLTNLSRNGTRVNGRVVTTTVVVQAGDELLLGAVRAVVGAAGGATAGSEDRAARMAIEVAVPGRDTLDVVVDAPPGASVGELVVRLKELLELSGAWSIHRERDGLLPTLGSALAAVPFHRGDRWVLAPFVADPHDVATSSVDRSPYTTVIVRGPRTTTPVVAHRVEPPPVPDDSSARARGVPWQVAASLVSLGVGVVVSLLYPSRGAWFLLAGAAGALACIAGLMADRGRRRAARQRFDEQMAELDHELSVVTAEQQRRLRANSPTAADALRTAVDRTDALWTRRPGDADFGSLRAGTADALAFLDVRTSDRWQSPGPRQRLQALIDSHRTLVGVPVSTDNAPGALNAVIGPDEMTAGVGRALLVQAAAHHAPSDLRIAVFATSDAWRWARWLPHAAAGDGTFVAWSGQQVDELTKAVDTSGKAVRWWVLATAAAADRPAARQCLQRIRERGGTVTMLAESPAALVADPTWLLDLRGTPLLTTAGTRQAVGEVETMTASDARRAVRALAACVDVATTAAGVPAAGALELWSVDDVTRLDVTGRWRRARRGLRAVAIGADDGGEAVTVDLRDGNPHLFVAGTTSSGKSELLRTIVAGFALEHAPDELSLFLLDFKGGAAFAALERLPHVVGLVTDIEADTSLAERTFQALDAELVRRKNVLSRARVADIIDYERSGAADADPLPSLVVVIDEFAAAMKQHASLAASLDMVAMQGRALGVHLVLAAQDPTGAVTNAIRANTGLWIALRVQFPEHSRTIIGTDEAAAIPSSAAGRAYLRRGGETPMRFQVARIARPVGEGDARVVDVRPFGAGGAALGTVRREAPGLTTELDLLVDQLHRAPSTWRPPDLWLPPLPRSVEAASLSWPERPVGRPAALLGLADEPSVPRQRPVGIDLAEAGHVAVFGRFGSGRTTTIGQVVADLAGHHSPNELHVYAVDAGDGALAWLQRLPHCGGVIAAGDEERLESLLRRLEGEIEQRRAHLGVSGDDFLTWRSRAREPVPFVVVAIDDIGAVRQVLDKHLDPTLADLFNGVCDGGYAVGVHLVLGAGQVNHLRADLLGRCGVRLALAVADSSDVQGFAPDVAARLPRLPAGRGYLDTRAGAVLVQVARPAVPEAPPAGHRGPGAPAPVLRLPRRGELVWRDLPAPSPQTPVAFALGGHEVAPTGADLERDPALLVLGDPGTGRTNALAVLTAQVLRAEPTCRVVVLDPRGTFPSSLAAAVSAGGGEVAAVGDDMLAALERSTTTDRPQLLVVDDAESLPSLVADPLGRLVRDARRLRLRTVAAGRSADMMRLYDDWARYLMSLRHAVLLNPSKDVEIAFDLRPNRSRPVAVPGRGILAVRGTGTTVQVARFDGVD